MKMKCIISLVCCFVFVLSSSAQKIVESYIPQKDSVRIGAGKKDYLPFSAKGFTLILPADTVIKGTIISLEGDAFNIKEMPDDQLIHKQANAKGFAVLYVCTGNPVEFYFSDKTISMMDIMINIAMQQYHLPNKNIFLLGVGLGGNRALRYVEYCKKGKSVFNPAIKGVALFDSPLDMARMWYEGMKGIKDNAAESAVIEGKMVTYMLKDNFGGTPKHFVNDYNEYSPYSHYDETNRHIPFFKNIAVRAYTDNDVAWWLQNKKKTYFEMNAPDMAGL
ncbi:MAG TPA: YqiA/YcfP family alpha/beta fold hydrolase, partial [Chitinophagaceae bacterium]|nr:YqiA/YcfP family alpha/beta fold hydrolase [Chitinophagaceae bacterium]